MLSMLKQVSPREAEEALVEFAREALEELVPTGWRVDAVRGESLDEPRSPDAVISLEDAVGERVRLLVEVKARATPRALATWAEGEIDRAPWLVVAPELSTRSKDVLRSAGMNWIDATGSVSLRLPRVLIEIDSPESRRQQNRLAAVVGSSLVMTYAIEEAGEGSRFVADLFAGDALRIVRRLLADPSRSWRVSEMVDATGVSKGWVSRVFATLERDAYLSGVPRGPRRLVDPYGLLDAWAEADARPQAAVRAVTTESLEKLRERAATLPPTKYALTGEAAADLVAPFARVSLVELYVSPNELRSGKTLKTLRARETSRGANVILLPAFDPDVLEDRESIKSPYGELQIVSRPQLYVDLRRRGGPAVEAADFLKAREAIWPRS